MFSAAFSLHFILFYQHDKEERFRCRWLYKPENAAQKSTETDGGPSHSSEIISGRHTSSSPHFRTNMHRITATSALLILLGVVFVGPCSVTAVTQCNVCQVFASFARLAKQNGNAPPLNSNDVVPLCSYAIGGSHCQTFYNDYADTFNGNLENDPTPSVDSLCSFLCGSLARQQELKLQEYSLTDILYRLMADEEAKKTDTRAPSRCIMCRNLVETVQLVNHNAARLDDAVITQSEGYRRCKSDYDRHHLPEWYKDSQCKLLIFDLIHYSGINTESKADVCRGLKYCPTCGKSNIISMQNGIVGIGEK